MKLIRKPTRTSWLLKLLICLLLIAIYYFDLLSYLEFKLQDRFYQSPKLIDPRIIVIGIDERTLNELGRFEDWNRQAIADAIRILNSSEEGKPAVIAVDVLFGGESNNPAADASLVEAAREGGNVVTVSIALWGKDKELNKTLELVERPFPALEKEVRYGLANGTIESRDGVIRTAYLHTEHEGQTITSFPYEIYKAYTGNTSIEALKNDPQIYITYSGRPGDYSWGPSFLDIFSEDFDPSFFADSIVMIGPYASATMDAYYTPISQEQMYGVEIHANVLQMLLEGNFKRPVPPLYNYLILILVLILGVLLAQYLDVRALIFAYGALIALYLFTAAQLFAGGHIILLLYPIFSLVLLFLYQTVSSYAMETLEKRRVKETFKKYVDPDLADQLLASGEAQSNEVGARKNIAVLFVDVRGFTTMSETLKDQPELIVKILNEYLEHTSTCIFKNGGSVDKFIGDATMALFNGFYPLDDYVFKAVKAALDIVEGAQQLSLSLQEKYNIDVGFGIGLQCGDAIVGNLGPSFRKDYTAIGDTVNTAARLESRALKSQILISEEIYTLLNNRIEAHFFEEMTLKGKAKPLAVYTVTGLKENPS